MSQTFAALVIYTIVGSITPGPNNLMVLTSGINFGFGRTMPHMLGITFGFMLMVALVGIGMAQVFAALPQLYTALKLAGIAYMLWLAWKITQSGPVEAGKTRSAPFTFLQAALFQWINPKAWIMSITAVASYVMVDSLTLNALIVAVVFAAMCFPCIALWTAFGVGMRRLLDKPAYLRAFNWTMAGLLVVSLWPVIAEFMP